MSAPVRIWLEVAHHEGFRTGGWAVVRHNAGEVSGTAAGERSVDAERAILSALAAALGGVAPDASVELNTTSPEVLALPARIAGAERGENPPRENLGLWAQAATMLRRPKLSLRPAELTRGGPAAFTAAWADLAYNRAKDRGGFTAAIPKPNLAKAGL